MTEYVTVLGDSARGIYMPKIARDLMYAGWQGIDEEQCSIIEAALGDDDGHLTEENEYYLDVWDEILDKAEFTDTRGDKWMLIQDDDLFAYNSTRIAQIEASIVEVCKDCRDYLIMGDHSDLDLLDAEHDIELAYQLAIIEENATDLGEVYEIPEEIQGFNEDLDPHDEFSARQCDCCGTRLAGDRYKLVERNKE